MFLTIHSSSQCHHHCWMTQLEDHPPYTTDFNAAKVSQTPKEGIPTYRIMDYHGNVIDPKEDPQVPVQH